MIMKALVNLMERHDGLVTWYWTSKDDDQSDFYQCSQNPLIFATLYAAQREDFKPLIWEKML